MQTPPTQEPQRRDIDGKGRTLWELFDNRRYAIDTYQREYKWQTKQLAELVDDLCGKFLEHYEAGQERDAVAKYGHYFLGSIILSQKKGQSYIIDGQQRLTTLTLFFVYLLHRQAKLPEAERVPVSHLILSTKYGKKSFNIDVPERAPCLDALYSGKPYNPTTKDPEAVRNMAARYKEIEESFPPDINDQALPYFLDWLLNNVHVVEITAYSDDDAYTIFETMNDRGLSLAPLDMLKSFLIANITEEPERDRVNAIWKQITNSINRPPLISALRDSRSFGIASLSCACGYDRLVNLQAELGSAIPPRLKYFMDPGIKPDEDPAVTLFHSKLVYLYLERERKSVVYIGSHNWTGRALGPGSPRNAEASMRVEYEFEPAHLDGAGTSVPAEVNRHLLDAWNAPACFPATSASVPAFVQWNQKVCKRATDSPVKEVTVVLAVCKTVPQPAAWMSLQDSGIYMQALEEDEGRKIYDSNQALVLVWESRASLAAGDQPYMGDFKEAPRSAVPPARDALPVKTPLVLPRGSRRAAVKN